MSRQWRILAIDDSLTIRKLLELSLGKAGYLLELASSGEEGIQRAQRTLPHLILLDYVLPDMKGSDVCAALARDERTRAVPTIIMSGKSDDVKGLFKEFTNVVEFVGKPFTPPEIKFHVSSVIDKLISASANGIPKPVEKVETPVAIPAFTFAQKQAAAKAIFAKLKERFAKIPEWSQQMSAGDSPPLFFARKILTPDLMDSLLVTLAPILREEIVPAVRSSPPESAALLSGKTNFLNLTALLKLLMTHGRTGTLLLQQGDRKTFFYIRRGELILITSNRPEEYARQATVSLEGILPAEIENAEEEQRRTGKPVFASYGELAQIPAQELPELLHCQGKRVLIEAMEGGPGEFEWLEHGILPVYVEAYGHACKLDQLNLERLRKVDDWAQIELHVSSLDIVFERCPGFSDNIVKYEITDKERRVLTLVGKRNSVKEVIALTGLATFEVFHVLFCMSQINLICRSNDCGVSQPEKTVRPILIADPDLSEIQQSLADLLLRRRSQPVPLININDETNVAARCLKEHPSLVVLSGDLSNFDLEKIAREIRSTLEISDTTLAAMIDIESEDRNTSLRAAGFDAVLVKPFLINDLLRLMAA